MQMHRGTTTTNPLRNKLQKNGRLDAAAACSPTKPTLWRASGNSSFSPERAQIKLL